MPTGQGRRLLARAAGIDTKAAPCHIAAAVEADPARDGDESQLNGGLLGRACEAVRLGRPTATGPPGRALSEHEDPRRAGSTRAKVGKHPRPLPRQNAAVPYRVLAPLPPRTAGPGAGP